MKLKKKQMKALLVKIFVILVVIAILISVVGLFVGRVSTAGQAS